MSINGKGTGKGIKMMIGVGTYFDKHGRLKTKLPDEATLNAKYASRRRSARKVRMTNAQGDVYYVDKPGKTERDHKSGAWNQRFGNRAARNNWLRDKNKGTTNPVNGWPIGTHIPA
jgi:hypothetical protein